LNTTKRILPKKINPKTPTLAIDFSLTNKENRSAGLTRSTRKITFRIYFIIKEGFDFIFK